MAGGKFIDEQTFVEDVTQDYVAETPAPETPCGQILQTTKDTVAVGEQ